MRPAHGPRTLARVRGSWAIIALACTACGEVEPQVTAGDGLLLRALDDRDELTLDPGTVVPRPQGCSPGELVIARGDGFACASLLGGALGGVAATRDDAEGLAERVRAVEGHVGRGCVAHGRAIDPELELSASTCLPWSEPSEPRRVWWSLGQKLKFRHAGGRPARGRYRATCAIQPRCGVGDGRWNTLTIRYWDPDGAEPTRNVRATLYAGDRALEVCGGGPCQVESSAFDVRDEAVMTLALGGYQPDLARAAREPTYYRLEVEMVNDVVADGELQFGGLRIE